MVKLDHLAITVRDYQASRDWYVKHLGLRVEFEIPDRRTAALQDDAGLTLFVAEDPGKPIATCVLTFQVDDVEKKHAELAAAGVKVVHLPSRRFWGYGAELEDPDGYPVWLWDERTMREKSGEPT